MSTYPGLYGWDTVFAITLAKFNRALATQAPSDKFRRSIDISTGSAQLDWQFGVWQASDVAGSKLIMHLPFLKGTQLTLPPVKAGDPPLVIPVGGADYTCTVEIEPVWTVGSPARLVAATTNTGDWANVTVKPRLADDFDNAMIIQTVLTKWFDVAPEAQALFLREMAVIDMNDDVEKYSLPWLRPVALGFAGGIMSDNVTKAVGFLALTAREKDQPVPSVNSTGAQLSPYAIPANKDAAFLISRELVLRNLILPGVASSYSVDGVGKLTDFAISGIEMEKLSNSAELSFKFDLNNKKQDATIEAGKMNLTLEGDRLNLTIAGMEMTTEYLGVHAVVQVEESLAVAMVPKGEQPGDLIFLLTNKGTVQPKIEIARTKETVIGETVVTVLATLFAIALAIVSFKGPLKNISKLTEQQAKIVARIIAGLVALGGALTSLVPIILAAMANGDVKKIPDFTPLLDSCLGRIAWPGKGKTRFVAVDAGFANGLQITIDPLDPAAAATPTTG